MSIFFVCFVMSMIVEELEPSVKWWQPFTKMFTWPYIIGRWMKNMVGE